MENVKIGLKPIFTKIFILEKNFLLENFSPVDQILRD
jgi:hypothetical protein